jgi:Malectin domain/Domain of unknown function (DUF4965)
MVVTTLASRIRTLVIAVGALATMSSARSDDLLGASATIAAPIPAEYRRFEPAYATFRQGKVFGYRFAVPPGAYRLEIGFLELIWRHPGQRVFDVVVNETVVAAAIDPVAAVGPAPQRFERTFDVAAEDAGLRVVLRAKQDQAAVAWLRLRNATSGEVVRFIDCGGDTDLDPPSVNAALSEQILARFGSRALLDLRPQWGDAEVTPLGKFVEPAAPLLLGFAVGGVVYGLPFARTMPDVIPFTTVAESRTLTKLRYDVTFPGHQGTIELHAPFDPGDLVASALPEFRIDFEARAIEGSKTDVTVAAKVAVATPGSTRLRDATVSGLAGAIGVEPAADGAIERGLFVSGGAVRAGPRRLSGEAPLQFANGVARASFHLVLSSGRPIVSDGKEEYRARVGRDSATPEQILARSLAMRDRLARASAVVDGLVEDASYPESLKELLRIAIPSFLMNTVDAETLDGRRFYSCIEGYCRYHATLDVEAHALPFYSWFAPELVALELRRAAQNISADDVMGHDIGRDGEIGKPLYPHEMPIEENTNFVLMLREYVARTGDLEFAREHAPVVARLLARVRACDEDGDGLADRDVANTIDDGSAAVQYSRGQTYLAVKTAAAFLAAAEMGAAGDPAAGDYRAYAARIRDTLAARSWTGEFFVVTPDASAEGLIDPWKSGIADVVPAEIAAGANGDEGVLEGAGSANGLAALGAIFALRTFDELPVPAEMLAQDLRTANARIRRRFVLAHAGHEVNGWVSLSLIRDAAAIHLGVGDTENIERYVELQRRRNRLDDLADWAGFCDSPFNRYLSYYPRGVAAIAVVDALAGLRCDRVKKRIELAPRVVPCRLPLPAFADWQALRVPWLEVVAYGAGNFVAHISDEDLLADCDVVIDLEAHGGGKTTIPRRE